MKQLFTIAILTLSCGILHAQERQTPQPGTGKQQILTPKEYTHIFLLMGQSNMAGYGRMLPEDKQPVKGIYYLPTKGAIQWKPASHPLHNRLRSDRFGLGLPFAKTYLSKHPGVSVCLIPVAWGGAPISKLNKGTQVYADAIKKAQFAAKQGTIKGILWHQGESDSVNDTLSNGYEKKLHQLIADLRKDLGSPQLPFIVGNLGEWYGQGRNPQHQRGIKRIKGILAQLPSKVTNTAFVPSHGLQYYDPRHKVHFKRESYIEFGKRYAAAFDKLSTNTK